MKAGLIFLMAGGVWLSAFSAAGQSEKQEAAVQSATDANGAPGHVVALNVLVLDREKRPVAGPDGKAIQVSEDGAPRTVQSVTGADGPVSVCLVIDESGSTKAMRPAINDAVVALVKGLPSGSEVMVVHFADKAFLDLPFTPVATVDEGKLRMTVSHGGTALHDAVVAAENFMLEKAHQKRRALVIISDGGDNASSLNLEQAIFKISKPGAPLLYALGFSDDRDSPSEHRHDEERLKLLTRAGGGVTLMARNAREMASKTDEISAMIGSQIVVSFASAESTGKWHKLEVRGPQGGKGEEVHAMPGFYELKPGAASGAK